MRRAAVLAAWALAAGGVAAAEYRSIGESPAVLYDAPSAKADRLFVAGRGYPFEVLVRLDQWTKVRDVGGEVAWVENRALGDKRTVMVNVAVADVRTAPDPQSPLVFEALSPVLLEVVEPSAQGWVRVRHRDGALGYVRAAHLWGL
jgi:SH3-like domain-containing protein